MLGGVVKVALLAGVGWYAYRTLVAARPAPVADTGAAGRATGPAGTDDLATRVVQVMSQAATAARQALNRVTTTDGGGAGGSRSQTDDRTPTGNGSASRSETDAPPEARAAAMAAMPAVQPPATIPEP